MDKQISMHEILEACSKILIRCFVISIAFLLFWFCIFLIWGDFAFEIHAKMFEIDRHDFDLMNYYGMGFLKISAYLLFLIPYISIKLILRKR